MTKRYKTPGKSINALRFSEIVGWIAPAFATSIIQCMINIKTLFLNKIIPILNSEITRIEAKTVK